MVAGCLSFRRAGVCCACVAVAVVLRNGAFCWALAEGMPAFCWEVVAEVEGVGHHEEEVSELMEEEDGPASLEGWGKRLVRWWRVEEAVGWVGMVMAREADMAGD